MPSEPYWSDDDITLHLGDCLAVLREMPDACVDAVVTDPPGAIGFMGRSWDGDRGGRDRWIAWLAERMAEACRVLKPGGHALVWSLPRTSGWTQMALEDAGFEVRDCIAHIFGSGYPKSLNVAKAIASGGGRPEDIRRMDMGDSYSPSGRGRVNYDHGSASVMNGSASSAPLPPEAAAWDGWGTALKPGQEMWWLARKPLAGRTVAATVLEYGTGALNIAACKVGAGLRENLAAGNKPGGSSFMMSVTSMPQDVPARVTEGRWPANVVFTHSAACEVAGSRIIRGDSRSGQDRGERPGGFGDVGADGGSERPNGTLHGDQVAEVFACAPDCPVGELDRQSVGTRAAKPSKTGNAGMASGNGVYANGAGMPRDYDCVSRDDSGGASRFFHTFRYQAKAPTSERPRLVDGSAHETVKPLGLMRHLVRLITPPDGTVLDLFAGSGATGEACLIEGFRCVLIDDERPHAELIRTRLRKPIQPVLFGTEAS